MNRPTVVIPHHGDPTPTLALVAAVEDQTAEVAGIIVVDDCSPIPFPETAGVQVVRREINGGFGSAVNSGLAAVDTELALVLNSDLEITDTFVQDLVAAAAPWQPAVVSPQIVSPQIVSPQIVNPQVGGQDGESQWVGRHFPTAGHQIVEWLTVLARFRSRLHEQVGHDTRCTTGQIVSVDWVMGAAMLLPMAEVRQVGGFDERFFMNAEEVDLQRRLRAIGVPSVFAGTVVATHEGGGSSDPGRRRQWLVDSRMKYARKWGGRRRLRVGLTVATGLNLVVNLVRQLTGREVNARAVARAEFGLLRRSRDC